MATAPKYKMLKDSSVEPQAKTGSIVYALQKCDYGASNDESRLLGVECKAFTLDPEGGYPFWTEPVLHCTKL